MIWPSDKLDYVALPHAYRISDQTTKKVVVLMNHPNMDFDQIYWIEFADQYHAWMSDRIVQAVSDVQQFASPYVLLVRFDSSDPQKTIDFLQHVDFDFLIAPMLCFDEQFEFVLSFFELAKDKEEQGTLIHLIMQLSLNSDVPSESLRNRIASFAHITEATVEELGKYISLVANQLENNRCAGIYAGLLCAVRPGKSPINKTIDVPMMKQYSEEQLQMLHDVGVVSFRKTIKKGVVCANATCAVVGTNSPHKNISNFLIVQSILAEVSAIQKQYIGSFSIDVARNDMESKLQFLLLQKQYEQIIKSFDLSCNANPLKGEIAVDLSITPIFALHRMKQYTQVRVSL